VPGEILGQIGNRVQHALRAFTPRDQKAVKTAAETFPSNKKLDVAKVISTLQVGEALVSTLQENGAPMPVDRTLMAPPRSRIGAITSEERATVRARSPVGGKYDNAVNRESAYEILTRRTAGLPGATDARSTSAEKDASAAQGADRNERATATVTDFLWGTKRRQGMVETMAKQAARTVGSQVGRQILRGVLGGLLGGTRAR
jgi:hypothetical protein